MEVKVFVQGSLHSLFLKLYSFQYMYVQIHNIPLTKCTHLLTDLFLIYGWVFPEESEHCVCLVLVMSHIKSQDVPYDAVQNNVEYCMF